MYKQVAVETEQQYRFAIGHKDVKDIIIPIDCFSDAKIPSYAKEIKESGKRPILRLERITRDYNPSYKKYIEDENVYGFLVENLDSFHKLYNEIKKYGDAENIKTIELDYTFNVWNKEAKSIFDNMCKLQWTYPIELSAYDLKSINMDTLVVYSDLPVMVSANCPMNNQDKCGGLITEKGGARNFQGFIFDRKNMKVPYKTFCKCCYSKIYNPDFYYIGDILKKDENIKKLDYKKIRFEFSLIKDTNLMRDVLDLISLNEKMSFTRGHIKKSIE